MIKTTPGQGAHESPYLPTIKNIPLKLKKKILSEASNPSIVFAAYLFLRVLE